MRRNTISRRRERAHFAFDCFLGGEPRGWNSKWKEKARQKEKERLDDTQQYQQQHGIQRRDDDAQQHHLSTMLRIHCIIWARMEMQSQYYIFASFFFKSTYILSYLGHLLQCCQQPTTTFIPFNHTLVPADFFNCVHSTAARVGPSVHLQKSKRAGNG